MSEDHFSNGNHQLSNDTGALPETQPEWFIDIDGEQYGPITKEQILELVDSGQIGPQHYVWRDGLEDWVRLQDVSISVDPTEQLQSAVENLPLSNGSEVPVESVRQPDELDASFSQNEIYSNADAHDIEAIAGEDSSPLDPSNAVAPERQNDELSAEREDGSATYDQSEPVESDSQDTLQSQAAEDPMPQDSEEKSEDGQREASQAADRSEPVVSGDQTTLQSQAVEDPMPQDSEEKSEDGQREVSQAADRSEPVVSGDQTTLQSQAAKDPMPQDSEEKSEAVQGEVSQAENQGIVENPASFEVPQNNAFGMNSEAKPFDDGYSLHYLVMNTLQTKGPEPPRTPDGYASEENSGLIDLGQLGQMEAGPPSMNEPVRAIPQFRSAFDSLRPTERFVPAESNRPIKLAAATGIGIIALSAAASFLILNNRQPVQDTVASTSAIVDVSSRELQNPLTEQEGERVAIQPTKTASRSAIPEIKAASAQKDPISTTPVAATVKKKSPIAATEGSTTRKKLEPNREKETRKTQAPIQPGSTSKGKSKASTDDLLDWAVGKGGKAPTPAAAEDKSISIPLAKPEAKQPEQPSREQTLAAMRKITPAVKACSSKPGAVATAAISVEGRSGKVKQVTINGVGAPVSECIEKAVSRARFPRFSKERFDIKYPFRL